METHGTHDQKTLDNLSTAMHGEAFAYVKNLLDAEHARKSGNKELADSCEKTANTERLERTSLKKRNLRGWLAAMPTT
jgi:rubrerythrin